MHVPASGRAAPCRPAHPPAPNGPDHRCRRCGTHPPQSGRRGGPSPAPPPPVARSARWRGQGGWFRPPRRRRGRHRRRWSTHSPPSADAAPARSRRDGSPAPGRPPRPAGRWRADGWPPPAPRRPGRTPPPARRTGRGCRTGRGWWRRPASPPPLPAPRPRPRYSRARRQPDDTVRSCAAFAPTTVTRLQWPCHDDPQRSDRRYDAAPACRRRAGVVGARR